MSIERMREQALQIVKAHRIKKQQPNETQFVRYEIPPSYLRGLPEPKSELLVITLAANQVGRELLTISRPIIRQYAERIGADYHEINVQQTPYPVLEKWRVYPLFQRYRRICWIDADVILAPSFPNLFELVPETHIGWHDDWPRLPDPAGWIPSEYEELIKSQGWKNDWPRHAWNSGIYIASREHSHIFAPPESPVPLKHCTEQWSETIRAHQAGTLIYPLPSALNWQWWFKRREMAIPIDGVLAYHYAALHDHGERMRQMLSIRSALYPPASLPSHEPASTEFFPARPMNINITRRYKALRKAPCPYRGALLGKESPGCGACDYYECQKFGQCTVTPGHYGRQDCLSCPEYPEDAAAIAERTKTPHDPIRLPTVQPIKPGKAPPPLKWAYGLTTVPIRMNGTLPLTLASLERAGFPSPRLFVDGGEYSPEWKSRFGCEITHRPPTALMTAGNWILGLYELYIRTPDADRYAMFQDDFITSPGLREYLEWCKYPAAGYWNLYTFPENEAMKPKALPYGWFRSNQLGKGAVALVFSREVVVELLSSRHMAERPQDRTRGVRAIDGGIVSALAKRKTDGRVSPILEYVHSPSLVQHIGDSSSIGNKPHPKAISFRGDAFDFRELIAAESTSAAK